MSTEEPSEPEPAQASGKPGWRERLRHPGRLTALLVAVAAIASVVVAGKLSSNSNDTATPEPAGTSARPPSLAQRPGISTPIGQGPSCVALDQSANVWVVASDAGLVSRVGRDGALEFSVDIPGRPYRCSWWGGGLWVSLRDRAALVMIDPEQKRVTQTIYVGENPTEVLASYGALWVITGAHSSTSRLVKIDAITHRRVGSLLLPGTPAALAAGGDGLWVGYDGPSARVDVVDPSNLATPTATPSATQPTPTPVVRSASVAGCASLRQMLTSNGLVWMVCQGQRTGEGQLVALDEGTRRVRARMSLPGQPVAITFATDANFWVYIADTCQLLLITPRELQVKAVWEMRARPGQLVLQPSPVDVDHPIDLVLLGGQTVWLAPYGQGALFGFDVG